MREVVVVHGEGEEVGTQGGKSEKAIEFGGVELGEAKGGEGVCFHLPLVVVETRKMVNPEIFLERLPLFVVRFGELFYFYFYFYFFSTGQLPGPFAAGIT